MRTGQDRFDPGTLNHSLYQIELINKQLVNNIRTEVDIKLSHVAITLR